MTKIHPAGFRGRSHASNETLKGTHRCRCGKASYATRKLARRAARVNLPGHPINEYRCGYDPMAWHYGHKPGTKPTDTKEA